MTPTSGSYQQTAGRSPMARERPVKRESVLEGSKIRAVGWVINDCGQIAE